MVSPNSVLILIPMAKSVRATSACSAERSGRGDRLAETEKCDCKERIQQCKLATEEGCNQQEDEQADRVDDAHVGHIGTCQIIECLLCIV